MDDLTNDQKLILTSMYKHFLELQPGLPPNEANFFINSNFVQENLAPQFSKDYVSDICWELKRKEYISCSPGDNLANNIILKSKTLSYMENARKRTFTSVFSSLMEILKIVK